MIRSNPDEWVRRLSSISQGALHHLNFWPMVYRHDVNPFGPFVVFNAPRYWGWPNAAEREVRYDKPPRAKA